MGDEMANRIAQGIISGAIITAMLSLILYFIRKKGKKKNHVSPSPVQDEGSKFFLTYFVQSVSNKGIRRLIVAAGFLLPLLIAFILCYSDARVVENDYGETRRYYDNSVFFTSFIFTFIGYWALYLITIWIYRGFQESRK